MSEHSKKDHYFRTIINLTDKIPGNGRQAGIILTNPAYFHKNVKVHRDSFLSPSNALTSHRYSL
nr:MAG TPA: hypothetical protein [Caudoviricetes sp.]